MTNQTQLVVTIDDSDVREKFAQLGDRMRASLELAAAAGSQVIVEAGLQREPNSELQARVVKSSRDRVDMAIGVPRHKYYYQILEVGAAQHSVGPHKRRALAFQGNTGNVVTRKAADHPGFGAQPFMRPAYDENIDQATEDAANALRLIINALVR